MPDRSGEAQVFGKLRPAFLPTLITHGVNVAAAVPEALRQAATSITLTRGGLAEVSLPAEAARGDWQWKKIGARSGKIRSASQTLA
jgi:hypothetical protein